jgi:hypothetical protein
MSEIKAISFVCNKVQHYYIMDGKDVWVIKKISDSIGKSSIAKRLNYMFNTEEVTDDNLYDWLDERIPKVETTPLRSSYPKSASYSESHTDFGDPINPYDLSSIRHPARTKVS